MRKFLVCTIILLVAGQFCPVYGALRHRYDFTNDPNDRLGDAGGTLIENTGMAEFVDGWLFLGNSGGQTSVGGTGDYVDLPNGTISALGNQATFEAWVQWDGPADSQWQRIFDFGTSDNGEDDTAAGGEESFYVFLTPQSGSTTLRFGLNRPTPMREERTLNDSPLPVGVEQHVAVVWDGANSTVSMYVNGVQVDQGQTHFALTDLNDNNNWLGRAQYSPDPLFVGGYNEFRIYDNALSAADIAADFAAGPDMTPARNVGPADGAVEQPNEVTLEWTPGEVLPDSVNGYDVYFGQDEIAVSEATTADVMGIYLGSVGPETTDWLVNGLSTDQTYYWRVDTQTDPNLIKGAVWSFETVKTRPILVAPAAVGALEGEDAVLRVEIESGTSVLDCQWYRYVDGVNDTPLVDGADGAQTCGQTLTTFTLPAVTPEMEGEYYVIVTNEVGPRTSESIALGVNQGLVHRYTFNHEGLPADDPNVVDVVGGANGTLVNTTGNSQFTDGRLVLGNTGAQMSNGGTGDYVDLPNGIISALENEGTFEMWTTWNGPVTSNWQRVFDFGASDGGEGSSSGAGNSSYVMMTPRNGANSLLRSGYRYGPNADERVIEGPTNLPVGVQKHVAVVWDGPAGEIRLYEDGERVATGQLHMMLSDLNDVNNWLGRAQWNDPMYTGGYDEFRIYDVALGDAAIRANYLAGPEVVEAEPCAEAPAADLNGDCVVDIEDFVELASSWLECGLLSCQ